MQCHQLAIFIEEQSDDPLPAVAALHLRDCTACRLLYDDLDAIRAAGREWGADTPTPSPRIWTSLRAQLETEGLIRPFPAAAPTAWSANWFVSPPRLAIAGAYLAVLLIAVTLANVRMDSFSRAGAAVGSSSAFGPLYPASVGPFSSAATAADLSHTLDGDMQRVMASLPGRDPSLATSLQHNLGIVDNLIAVCEKSVREQPHDALARQYLYGASQQKAVLLATAMDRSMLEDR